MIFVTVGSQLPFDRLIGAMDDLAPTLGAPVFAQIGRTTYRPRAMEYAEVLAPVEFERRMKAADVVVAHAGIGTVLQARDYEKRLVVLPRRAALGEHRNDHQLATARELRSAQGVRVADDRADLERLLSSPDFGPARASARSEQHERLISTLKELIA